MEGSEEVVGGTKDVAHIVKGKRTKRQRPQSPIPFTITSHLSGGEGGGGHGGTTNGDHTYINNNNNSNSNNNSSSSRASSDEFAISTTTEDEDTARLLILLAQGQSRESSTKNDHDHNQEHQDQDYGTSSIKFNSKRYIETSSTANGKAGMYVYECKTCNRTFPSFQALGGHRASHKKPKNMAAAAAAAAAEEKKLSFVYSDEDEAPFRSSNNNNNISHITYQLSNINNNPMNKSTSSPKIHECSYCGAEFTSGQALGGHMRRHRGANNVTAANTALSLSPLSPNIFVNQDSEDQAKKLRNINGGLSLSLDLNLPAPEDDHNKFALGIKQHQHQPQPQPQPQQNQQQQQQQNKEPTLVLSTTPTLVDCHY